MGKDLIRQFIKESLLQEKIRTKKGVKSIAGKNFNFQKFKSLPTRKAMLLYASIFLEEIGGSSAEEMGTSRKVFIFSGNKVLKIAKNEAGVGQNKAEIDVHKKPGSPAVKVVTKVHDHDPEFRWLTADIVKVNKIDSENTFYRLAGLPFELFKDIVQSMIIPAEAMKVAYDPKYNRPLRTPKTSKEVNEDIKRRSDASLFVKSVMTLIEEHEMMAADILKLDHWGVLNDKLMLLDYGFTVGVFRQHYKGKTLEFEDMPDEHKVEKPAVLPAFRGISLPDDQYATSVATKVGK